MPMIFSCSTCDTMRINAPLCVRGEAAEFNDESFEFVQKGKCPCVCHRGSANVTAGALPIEGGPGAFGDPDDNGEGTEGIERDRLKAKELISV